MGRAIILGDIISLATVGVVEGVADGIATVWQPGDIIVNPGDCSQNNADDQAAAYDALNQALYLRFGLDWKKRDEVVVAPGNHDWRRDIFGQKFGFAGDVWHVEIIDNARWITLDSMDADVNQYDPGVNQRQLDWLDGVLSTPHNGPTFAVMHHPRKSAYIGASHYNDNQILDPLYSRLYAAGVDMVWAGHSQRFSLTEKLDHQWNRKVDGFRQGISSCGGWSHQASSKFNDAQMLATDGSQTLIGSVNSDDPGGSYGFVLLEWGVSGITTRYYSTDGVERFSLVDDPRNTSNMGTLTDAALYPDWGMAGLTPTARQWVRNQSLVVHSTLVSPTRAQLQSEIDAASAAGSVLKVPRRVHVSGTVTLDALLTMASYCVVAETPGLTLNVVTGVGGLPWGVIWNSETPDARSVTVSGVWGENTMTMTADPADEMELGVWQIGTNGTFGPGGQQLEVTAINGNELTVTPALARTFTDHETRRHNGGDDDFVTAAGWEGGTFDTAHDIDRMFQIQSARDGWLVDVRVNGVDATDDLGIQRAHVFIRQSLNVLVEGNQLLGVDENGDLGQGYGIENQSHSSLVAIRSNRIRGCRHSILNSGGASANTVLFNDLDDTIHPNWPNPCWPDLSGHGHFDSTLIAFNSCDHITLRDAGGPGSHNVIGWNRLRLGMVAIEGTDSLPIGEGTVIVNNQFESDHAKLLAEVMPSINTDSTAGNPSPPKPAYHGTSVRNISQAQYEPHPAYATDPAYTGDNVSGDYYPPNSGPDPFLDTGLGYGVWIPTPSRVDFDNIIVDETALHTDFPRLSWLTVDEPTPTVGARTVLHTQVEHFGNSRSIPLNDWAGPNRHALVIATNQGTDHTALEMGTELGDLDHLFRLERGTNAPGQNVWAGAIPAGTTAADLPIGNVGGGWVLRIYEGPALDGVLFRNVVKSEGLLYGIDGNADVDTLAVVATNGPVANIVASGGYTVLSPGAYYAEPVAVFGSDVDATVSWGESVQHFSGITVEVPYPTVNYGWQDLGHTNTGVRVGAGVGDDVDSTDADGARVAAGEIMTARDHWSIDLDTLPPVEQWAVSVAIPDSYDPSEGYYARLRYEKPDGTPVGDWVVAVGSLLAGDDRATFRAELSATGTLDQNNDGVFPVDVAIELIPDLAETLRPPAPETPDAVQGRLEIPRMVELWRSQGGGGIPTPTTADRYVDPTNGSDSNDGLTRATAWKTRDHAYSMVDQLGLAVGYMSGTISSPLYRNREDAGNDGRGSGTNFLTRMNTHYVLEGERCFIRGGYFGVPATWHKNMAYIQMAGFELENTDNRNGGIEYASGINNDDYDAGPDNTHHFIFADMTFIRFNAHGVNGLKARYVRVLGCKIESCGWWHNGGASGTSWNDLDVENLPDDTPAGLIDGQPIDVWVQNCVITDARQKTDSSDLDGGAGRLWDGNAYIFDYSHVHKGEYIRVALVFCIAHNTGGKSFNSYQGADELWIIGCAGFYGGRHLEYVNTSGDPVQGMDPSGQSEYMIQSYPNNGGKSTIVHFWNSYGVPGPWMSNSPCFEIWSGHTVEQGGQNIVTVDARGCKRQSGYKPDSWSTEMGDAKVVNDSMDYTLFDPRPLAGSPLLTGGDGGLWSRAGLTTDFAGNAIDSSSTFVGPYSRAVSV